jgi:hypothetical protein
MSETFCLLRDPPSYGRAIWCILLLAALLLGVSQVHAGLVLHYAFDETSGTIAADSSGSGNTGTLNRGGSTPWVAGRIGNALSIDSVTKGYVRATGYKGVTGTNARSLAYWTKTTAPNTYDYAVHWGGSGSAAKVWAWTNGTQARMDYSGVGVGSAGPIITDDTWHHVVFASAAGATASQTKVYVDGILLTGTGGNSVVINTGSTSDVFIGTDTGSGSRYEGLLDDVRIYDHELSAGEVSTLAAMTNSAAPEPGSVFASLGLLSAAGCGLREWRRRKKKAA